MSDIQSTPPLMEICHVRKSYCSDGGNAVDVLKDVNIVLSKGESLAILGPSGCGKSTLLNLMGTLDRPDSGKIFLEGIDLQSLDSRSLARVRNRRIGFIFQLHHLLPQCTVLENVLLPTLADPKMSATPGTRDRAERLLACVGLGERRHHRPGQLSGGERQRTAVVRALINEPVLLLADEPTGALDRTTAESLGELLVKLNRDEGVALAVVTHSPELARRMSRVCEIRDGQLVS